MIRLFGFAFLAVLLSVGGVRCAQAQTVVSPTGGMFLNYVPGGATMTDGGAFDAFMGRIYTAPVGDGGASVAERYGFQLGGEALQVSAARTIPFSAVAAAVAAAGVAGVEAGGAISHFLGNDTATIGPIRCTASYAGWKCDAGQTAPPPQMVTVWAYYRSSDCNGSGYLSAQVAGQAEVDCYASQLSPPYSAHLDTVGVCFGAGALAMAVYQGSTLLQCQQLHFSSSTVTKSKCPGYTDALNPAWSRQDGANAPDPDGKCPTGRYSAQSAAQMQTAFADPVVAPQLKPKVVPALLDDVSAKGVPISGASERTLSGPASITGPTTSTTTTTSDGTQTQTRSTPTTNYTYNTNTVVYNISNTTTSTTGGVTTTTVTGTAPAASGAASSAAADPTDPCTVNPGRVGCSQLGNPSDDAPQWITKPIAYAAEELGFTGSCPAPWTTTAFGHTVSMSYDPICNNAQPIALAVNLLAAVTAGFFVIKGAQ